MPSDADWATRYDVAVYATNDPGFEKPALRAWRYDKLLAKLYAPRHQRKGTSVVTGSFYDGRFA